MVLEVHLECTEIESRAILDCNKQQSTNNESDWQFGAVLMVRVWGSLVLLAMLLVGCTPYLNEDYDKTPEGKIFVAIYDAVLKDDKATVKFIVRTRWKSMADVPDSRINEAIDLGRNFIAEKRLRFVRFSNWQFTVSARDGRNSEIKGYFVNSEKPENGIEIRAMFSGPADNLSIVDIKVQEFSDFVDIGADGQAAKFVSILKSSLRQPIYLVLAIASTFICFSALTICLLTKHLPKKWFWAAFTLIGVTPVSANFVTGDLAIAPLSVVFGGGGISPYAAIIGLTITPLMPSLPGGIIFSLPLGALVFLFIRNSRSKKSFQRQQ